MSETIELKLIEDRFDRGCVNRRDPDGAYLLINEKQKDYRGWIQVTVIGPLGELKDYLEAAELECGRKFQVDKVIPLEHVGCDIQTQFAAVKRGFVGIIMRPI